MPKILNSSNGKQNITVIDNCAYKDIGNIKVILNMKYIQIILIKIVE